MVMPNKEAYTVQFLFRNVKISIKLLSQWNAFLFLVFSLCISVFFTAQRACDVVNNTCKFKGLLQIVIQIFLSA